MLAREKKYAYIKKLTDLKLEAAKRAPEQSQSEIVVKQEQPEASDASASAVSVNFTPATSLAFFLPFLCLFLITLFK